jgi:hypothetical protein
VTKTPTLNEIFNQRIDYVRHIDGKISEAGSSIPGWFAKFIVELSKLMIKFGHGQIGKNEKSDCLINGKIGFNYQFV